ncbi:MAG TPA: M23 family metallopeptidase [Gemmatimonadales bacterium]|nr:M23 family metallopeptidase [Gemmatimonadales bacterium]
MRPLAGGLAGAVLAGLALAGTLEAQAPASAITLRPIPPLPLKGTVAWLAVDPAPTAPGDTLLGVEGEGAGEPLHFAPTALGYAALLGVPLEGDDSLDVTLRLDWHGRTDTTRVRLALARPELRAEKLRVPPAMASPDSAARARIDRELARSREVSRRSHETPRLWSGPFRLPRPSRITSVYGTAREYNGEITSRHLGTDFAGATGAPVLAAARGLVALVADFYLAGHAVYLDHGAGLVTGYFHLSRIDVAEGDTVAAGQPIGAVGRSGRVTGPHLHWIARYGTITVDPMSLVRLERPSADR